MNKPTKSNLCVVVRDALTLAGYSHYKVLNAVNSALGELEVKKNGVGEDKTGSVKMTGKKEPRITVSVKPGTLAYATSDTTSNPLLFIAWHDGMEGAMKITTDFQVTVPGRFTEWLNGFAKAKPVEQAAQANG